MYVRVQPFVTAAWALAEQASELIASLLERKGWGTDPAWDHTVCMMSLGFVDVRLLSAGSCRQSRLQMCSVPWTMKTRAWTPINK